MKSFLFFFAVIAISVTALSIANNSNQKFSELTLANLVSIATVQAEGTGNTGPASVIDCAGWGTGSAKICLCTNSYDCTETPCQ